MEGKEMSRMLKTNYWLKPIPFRGCDWEAWIDGTEETVIAYGATENQAITNLLMQWCDVWAARCYEGDAC